jgi:glycosyltransferase involved in cell wall biosynthesis
MHVIFVSTSIPPYPDMQAIRNVYLIKGLIRKNIKVTVITSEYKWANDPLEKELEDKVDIIRTKPPMYIQIGKKLNQGKSKLAAKVFNVLIHYIVFPDMHMFWNYSAVKEINKIINKGIKVDGIVTSSGSYTAHLVGTTISKRYNIPWIAEYGDPWGIDRDGNKKKINFWIERNILKNNNGIVLTTPETIENYQSITDNKYSYSLVPCGYESIIEDTYEDKKGIDIYYTGVAYASSRNLSNVIESVGQLNENIRFNIVGGYSEKYKTEADRLAFGKVTFTGRVSYQESIKMISKADILVHIGNKGTMQVPGKTYIYLSSQKPIIYISQGNGHDPTYEVMKKFPGVVFCDNDTENIMQAIKEIYYDYNNYKKLSTERTSMKELSQYSWDKVSDDFADFIINQM